MAWILVARVSSGGTVAATTTGSATMAASTATTSVGNEWDDEESVPKCKESKVSGVHTEMARSVVLSCLALSEEACSRRVLWPGSEFSFSRSRTRRDLRGVAFLRLVQ